ncbi:MAG TPA: hypothetical protein PLG27_03035, partial [Candidatus Latescibacteria bacterium]|nr:hypothetical protein [Candidatus Latescibacterota bacterium]
MAHVFMCDLHDVVGIGVEQRRVHGRRRHGFSRFNDAECFVIPGKPHPEVQFRPWRVEPGGILRSARVKPAIQREL